MKVKIPPKTPYNGNRLVQFIRFGDSIRLKWVKQIKDRLNCDKTSKRAHGEQSNQTKGHVKSISVITESTA